MGILWEGDNAVPPVCLDAYSLRQHGTGWFGYGGSVRAG